MFVMDIAGLSDMQKEKQKILVQGCNMIVYNCITTTIVLSQLLPHHISSPSSTQFPSKNKKKWKLQKPNKPSFQENQNTLQNPNLQEKKLQTCRVLQSLLVFLYIFTQSKYKQSMTVHQEKPKEIVFFLFLFFFKRERE